MKTMNILCVDDEPWVLKSIKRLLKGTNYSLYTANSGKEAIDIISNELPSKESIDLVISDFRMPEMTGVEFLNIAREKLPDATHILLSSWTDGKKIREAIENGAIDKVISKPWNSDELLSEIHHCFAQSN